MKLIFTLLFLISSFFCIGQINADKLIGNWKSDNGIILKDSTLHVSVKEFVLSIRKNKSFQIHSDKKSIKGKWILKDSVLYLIGKREAKIQQKNKLKIYTLTKSKLFYKLNGMKTKKPLVLKRVNKK